MKTAMLVGAVAASALLSTAAVAAPTCRTSYLLGTWLGTDLGSGDAYCLVEFKKNGWFVRSSCPDLDTLTPEATLAGRFSVKRDCTVSGDFDEAKDGRKKHFLFTGTTEPRRGIITGRVRQPGKPGYGYKFVQQY